MFGVLTAASAPTKLSGNARPTIAGAARAVINSIFQSGLLLKVHLVIDNVR